MQQIFVQLEFPCHDIKLRHEKLVLLTKHSPEKRRINLFNQKQSPATQDKQTILLHTLSGAQKF
jgi:hypothetical protein